MTTDMTINHPITETSFAPLSDEAARAIQKRGTQYFTDICIINSDELIPYLLWLFDTKEKPWPIPDNQMKNLSLLLSGISKKQIARDRLLSRQAVYTSQRTIFRSINLRLPTTIIGIDNPDWTNLFLDQLLFNAGINHKKFLVQLTQQQDKEAPRISAKITRDVLRNRLATYLAATRARKH